MKTIKRLSLCALFALCSLYANAYDFSAENEEEVAPTNHPNPTYFRGKKITLRSKNEVGNQTITE